MARECIVKVTGLARLEHASMREIRQAIIKIVAKHREIELDTAEKDILVKFIIDVPYGVKEDEGDVLVEVLVGYCPSESWAGQLVRDLSDELLDLVRGVTAVTCFVAAFQTSPRAFGIAFSSMSLTPSTIEG